MDVLALFAERTYEFGKERIHFWGAAGYVHQLGLHVAYDGHYLLHGFPIHHLVSGWTGFNVAVHAGVYAAKPNVHLDYGDIMCIQRGSS